ncbi:2,3-diaminopropionate biosynthesis protein SbnB [Actinoplanes sp. L3-i22]|uniref:2,3-diaminopropionate biosynthesis protein SbnB n=1 Tax=Actinoplanes sp. L3-i22 TaxID=2836373 RepID=UPI001C78D4E8|nr:2,3-diaminopropionate biosynthesis protein SbnB [Actinoplanes sp. L3-i22]BCY14204.1 2,3-diaminopropionate biosynthesis protein SbnB [Actinoplanes sp. L3-i22]
MPNLSIVGHAAVTDALDGAENAVIDCVRDTYLLHESGRTVNPDSYFLRFPDKPDSRIIALPAFVDDHRPTAGLKWISSFPANVGRGRQRASAVLVLNDYETGYPIAVLESAAISAARTAASAALAAGVLTADRPATVGVIGAGYIARTICRYLDATGTPLDRVVCHDTDDASAAALARHLDDGRPRSARVGQLGEALDADLVVFATTALAPYVPATHRFRAGQLVLHVSLRDLAPETLLAADNVLDDIDHCLKAQTSPHLAETLTGGREFVTGTLAQVILGKSELDPDRATIFSPFGLGVLDIAVGRMVLDRAVAAGRATAIDGFFGDQIRW